MKARAVKKKVEGVVKSAAMDKTISVVVERLVKHRTYQKYIRKRSVFKAHDEKNEAKPGDRVQIAATRPLSKTKNWRLVRVMERLSCADKHLGGLGAVADDAATRHATNENARRPDGSPGGARADEEPLLSEPPQQPNLSESLL